MVDLDLDLPDRRTCDALEKLGECDSIIVDPHKLGYVPYPAGVVAFKSNLVRPLMRQNAPYIEEAPVGPEEESTSENIGVYILEGSKPGATAASVWLSHASIPLDTTGHGALVRDTIRNACELAALLKKWPELTGVDNCEAVVLCPPESNIVCYAFKPKSDSWSSKELNELNRSLHRKYSLPVERRVHVYDQKFFLSRTVMTRRQYAADTVAPILSRLGVTGKQYNESGIFLLRSTLMNPWYRLAKIQGRDYLVAMVSELYKTASEYISVRSIVG
jgi:glutamate/tyrosine decarboxylase-like PLP-dependent enzyme